MLEILYYYRAEVNKNNLKKNHYCSNRSTKTSLAAPLKTSQFDLI